MERTGRTADERTDRSEGFSRPTVGYRDGDGRDASGQRPGGWHHPERESCSHHPEYSDPRPALSLPSREVCTK